MHTPFMRSVIIAVTFISLLGSAVSSAFAMSDLRAGRGLARHAGHPHRQHHRRPNKQHPPSQRPSAVAEEITSGDEAPVVLLGEEKVRSGSSNLAAGESEAFQFRARSSGISAQAHIYLGVRTSATALVVGVYSSVAGRPGTLLTSGSLRSPRGGGWATVRLGAEQLLSGSSYWLAVLASGGALRIRDRHEGTCAAASSSQRAGALSSSWRTSVVGRSCPISAYVSGPSPTLQLDEQPVIESSPVIVASTGAPPIETPPLPVELPAELPVELPVVLAPLNLLAPSISGSAVEGQTLEAASGVWTESPTSLAYQWQDCNALGLHCTDIAGAVGERLTLGAGDVGHTIRVTQAATNSAGTAMSSSLPTLLVSVSAPPPPAPPSNLTLPSIAGVTMEGQTLQLAQGEWSGSPTSFTYQWQRCDALGSACADVSGARSTTLLLDLADIGHTFRVLVTAVNAGGATSATSLPTALVVEIPPLAPLNTSLPTATGVTVEGQTLKASSGTWTGSTTSFSYQWQDCTALGLLCSNIVGATSAGYSLTASDVGDTIRVIVTANGTGGSTPASSLQTAAVTAAPPPAPTNTSLPLISGSAVEGQTLTVSNGSWSGSPNGFTYAWQRCNSSGSGCAVISAATLSTYTIKAADVGHTLRAVVTAANTGGSGTASTAQTALIAAALPAAPANTALPAVSGPAVEAQTLEISNGSWTGSPTSFSYAWQRCSAAGSECAAINGAGTSRYALVSADVGHTLRALVTATNAGGSTIATSAQTSTIVAAAKEEKGGGGGESLFISASGKDSSPCSESQPCLTMGHAYEKATPGSTVEMLAGSYPGQTISGAEKGTAHVVFEPLPGASVKVTGTIYVFGSHVTVEGMTVQDVTIGNYDQTPGRANATDVSLLNLTGRNFQIDSAKSVTVEGGSWGPASACGGPIGGDNNSIRQTIPSVAPENIVINDTVIHDVQSYNLIECHIEGLAIFAGNHVTVSNSKFYGNSIYNVFIQANSGGSPNNITIAKNWMAEAVDNSAANGHAVGYNNGIAFGSEISSNLTLMGNHFNGVVNINDDGSISNYTNTTMQYNFGKMAYSGYPCGTALKGVVWSENVWQNDKCGSSDVNLSGAAMPYVKATNVSTLNYTLTGTYANWPAAAGSGGPGSGGSGSSAPANTSPPVISGTAAKKQVLSATTGAWSGSPTSYAYQWQDCNAAGISCSAIAGASASKYTLTGSDVKHTMRVVVTASGSGGSARATSAQTGVVTASAGSGGSSAMLFVSASGSDSGSCSKATPCKSLGRAYTVAQAGEVVRVAAGSYADSSVGLVAGKGSGAPVVFEPVAGASVRFSKKLDVEAHDVELKGFAFERELYFGENAENVVARGNALHNFEIIANGSKAPKGISIIGGTAGPVADKSDNENNLIATNGPETTAVPTKITIEGVLIHEYTKVGSAHVDCLQIWAGNEVVVRGNTFKRCAVFDIFLQSLPNGHAGTPKNVTIENNVLEKTIEGFYSIFLPRHNEGNPEHFENVVIRNNSATQAISADPRATFTNVKIDGNIAPQIVFWNEATEVNQGEPAGVEMDYNVLYGAGAKKIGSHDETAPAGFVSESSMNLHLTEASAAIKHGDPADYPATDIEGKTRPNPPDAGAYQHAG